MPDVRNRLRHRGQQAIALYGWQRWPGDEHKSGWWLARLEKELRASGFEQLSFGVELFLEKGIMRNRFKRPHDAHIYCRATKSPATPTK